MSMKNPVHLPEFPTLVRDSRLVPTTPADRPPASRDECVFCRIIAGEEPATVVRRWADAVAIIPLRPVTTGHILVLPTEHVPDIGTTTEVSGRTMERAAELAGTLASCNLITSKGAAATQSIRHLHIHVVPRRPGDGLALPWTGHRDVGSERAAPPASRRPSE